LEQLRLREAMGYALTDPEQTHRARIVALLDGDDAALAAAQSEGRALAPDEAVAYALGE
jgi:predicted ATPase